MKIEQCILTNVSDPFEIKVILLGEEEQIQLLDFLSHQYISHEFHPLVHDIIKRLRKEEDERQNSKARSEKS